VRRLSLDKIFELQALQLLIQEWRSMGDTIVFTNGCFDLLHLGHIDYLEKAKALGDRLIIAINSDESVRNLKGDARPIQNITSRSRILAAMTCVDAVIVFHTTTPLGLIESIKPDVLVKGGDWRPEQIVGASFVLAHQGTVTTIPFLTGYSTTLIEQKIKMSS
jgi:D-glycero-beta-D-manno-heptose 1-phosphate adenylyltransferase